MLRVLKIMDAGSKGKGKALLGLLIMQTDEGFYIVAPESGNEVPNVLAKTKFINFNNEPPLFSFEFEYKKNSYAINVNQADPNLQDPDLFFGKWTSPPGVPVGPEQEEDNFTASGSGKGVPGDEDEDEARAASAS